MTPDKFQDDMARLRHLLVSREPDVAPDRLVPITEQRAMLPGTTAIALQPSFRARPSGLLAPASTFPEPLDLARVYLTAQEVFQVEVGADWVQRQLEETSILEVLDFVCATLTLLHRPGQRVGDLDHELVDAWFSEPTRTRAHNLLREDHRTLVAPQALLVLLKLACFWCPDNVPGDSRDTPLVGVLLAIAGDLHMAGDEDADDSDEATVVDTEVSGLARHLVANQHFNSPQDEDHLMARFIRRWTELPALHAGSSKVVDLPAIYARVTGVDLNDLATVTVAIWASVTSHGPHFSTSIFDSLGWSPTRLSRTLDLLTADLEDLRDLVAKETSDHGLSWSFSTFEQYPLIRRPDGLSTVVDPDLLLRRVFGWLPLFDVLSGLYATGDRADRKLAAKVEGCVRHLGEVYAHEALTSLAGGTGSAQRLYGDTALKAAFTKPGRKVADAVLDYGDAWVVAEVTTSQLTRRSVSGMSDTAVSDDIDKLVHEVEQIEGTITSLRENETALTKAPPVPGRTYYPLLVVAEGFPINPITTTLLLARVTKRGLLLGHDVAPLEIVDTVELEMLEGLQEHHGPGLRQVLESKRRGSLARCSVRDFLLREQNEKATRPARVRDLMNKAFEPALEAFRPSDAA